jgi:hypothetical protein
VTNFAVIATKKFEPQSAGTGAPKGALQIFQGIEWFFIASQQDVTGQKRCQGRGAARLDFQDDKPEGIALRGRVWN